MYKVRGEDRMDNSFIRPVSGTPGITPAPRADGQAQQGAAAHQSSRAADLERLKQAIANGAHTVDLGSLARTLINGKYIG